MRLIIAGGRDWADRDRTRWVLDDIREVLEYDIAEVISGGAAGADALGEAWARDRKVPVKVFTPDWSRHGRAAGPIRNRAMATYAAEGGDGGCVIFPGGKGTESMLAEARRAGLLIFDRRNRGTS